jgi:hypothetical protein
MVLSCGDTDTAKFLPRNCESVASGGISVTRFGGDGIGNGRMSDGRAGVGGRWEQTGPFIAAVCEVRALAGIRKP